MFRVFYIFKNSLSKSKRYLLRLGTCIERNIIIMSPNQIDSIKNCIPDLTKNVLGSFVSSESSNKSQKERTEIEFSENNLERWKCPENKITIPTCNNQLQSGSYRHGISNQYYSQNLYPLPSKPAMVLKKNVSENQFFSSPLKGTIETENNVKESIYMENDNQQQFKVKDQIQMENSFPSLSSKTVIKSPISTKNEYVSYSVPNLLSPLPDDNLNFMMEQNYPNTYTGNSSVEMEPKASPELTQTPPSTLTKKKLPQIPFWTYMKNCRSKPDSEVSTVEYEIILEDLDNDPFTISDENKENHNIVINKQPNYFDQIKDYLEPCDSPPLLHIPEPIIFPIIPNKRKYEENETNEKNETKLEKREYNYSNTNGEQTNCGALEDALNQQALQNDRNTCKEYKSNYDTLHKKPNTFTKSTNNLGSSISHFAKSKSTSEKQNTAKKQTSDKSVPTRPVIHPYPPLYPQYQNLLGTDYRDPFLPKHVYPDFSKICTQQHFNASNMFSYPYGLFFPHGQFYYPKQNLGVINNTGQSHGHPGSSNFQDVNPKDMYSLSQEAISRKAQQSYIAYNISLNQNKLSKSDDTINNKSLGSEYYRQTIFPSTHQKSLQTTPRQGFPNPLQISPPNILPDFWQNWYYQNYQQNKKDVNKTAQGNTFNRQKTTNFTLNNYNSFSYQSVTPQNNDITKRFNFHYKNYDDIKETTEHFIKSVSINEDISRVLQDVSKGRKRTQFTSGQLNRLEFFFSNNQCPTSEDREKLSRETKLKTKTIITWFHNKKKKLKREQEKLDKFLNEKIKKQF